MSQFDTHSMSRMDSPSASEVRPMLASIRHFPAISALRLASAFGIIWSHTCSVTPIDSIFRWRALGAAGLMFFICISTFLTFRSGLDGRKSLAELTTDRFRRILIPFAIWSVLYLLCLIFKQAMFDDRIVVERLWQMPLEGSSVAYWFLPFIFIISVLTYAVAGYVGRLSNRQLGIWMILLLTAGAMAHELPNRVQVYPWLPRTILYGANHVSLVLYVWVLAIWVFRFHARKFPPAVNVLLGTVVLVCITLRVLNFSDPLLIQCAGIILFLLAIQMPQHRWLARIDAFGKYAYGIYLLHVFTLFPATVVAWRLPNPGLGFVLIASVLSFAACLLGVMTLYRFRALRWLMP